MNFKKIFATTACALGLTVGASQASTVHIFDTSINFGQTVNWTKNNEYILNEIIYVEDGARLNIEAGTVIRSITGMGSAMGCLIICTGGKINAIGTKDEPIIMTAITDNLKDPYDAGPSTRGLWAGLIIQGRAPMARGTAKIDGVSEYSERTTAGGSNSHDNSGVLKYVSIRHAGAPLVTGDEISGLTMYGVGDSTVVENVEVYANDDDGIEIFGGTVNIKYCLATFCNDDAFDFDDGWRGKAQFLFSIQNATTSLIGKPDHGFEINGLAKDANLTLNTKPTVYNFTTIGPGKAAVVAPGTARRAMEFNERAAGTYANGVLLDWPLRAINFAATWDVDAEEQVANGELLIRKCMFYDFGAGSTFATILEGGRGIPSVSAYNTIANPSIRGISREIGFRFLDPRPTANSPVFNAANYLAPPKDGFFTAVHYAGAFPATGAGYWIDGWTAISRNKILSPLFTISPSFFEGARAGSNAKFDLQFLVKMGGSEGAINTTSPLFKIFIDNTDITSAFLTRHIAATSATVGATTYRIPDVKLSELGGVGIHKLSATIPMLNGMILSDTMTVHTLF